MRTPRRRHERRREPLIANEFAEYPFLLERDYVIIFARQELLGGWRQQASGCGGKKSIKEGNNNNREISKNDHKMLER